MKKLKYLLAGLFMFASAAQANTISTSVFVDNAPGESVQYVDFHVTDAGFFSISAKESFLDTLFTNPHVLLFSDSLSNINFIAGDDDSGPGDNSLIKTGLSVGRYILAVSNSLLTVSEAVAGFNADVNWKTDGKIKVTISSEDGVATFDNPSAVPVPAAAWLFGTGLIGFAGLRKRKSA